MRTLFLPPAYQDSAESGRLILRDGSTAFIRPSEPSDREPLREFFKSLSLQSRRQRFFSIAEPSEAILTQHCDSSNPSVQLTLIVSRIIEGDARIIATGSYVARDETSAEVAFTVDDEFQGKGLGGLLLERLALLAARHGLTRFWAVTHIDNHLMLDTFRRSGFPIRTKIEDDYVELDFSVAPSEDSATRSEMRDRVFTTASLHPFFQPRSVAFIGASRNSSSVSYHILDSLIRGGFSGPIHVVNPHAAHVHSIPTLASARDLPKGTDLALIAVPRNAVMQTVDDCAAAGVRAVIVVTAGYAEADEEGERLQQFLAGWVRGLGIRMLGPNSMGLLNADPRVKLNASLAADLPPYGDVAMSTQSGALGLAMLSLARHHGLGVSTCVNVGNKADISGNDLLQYWQGDTSTRVVLLYVESFGNPRRFARIARTMSRTKPIVVTHPGHDIAVQALFRHTGVIRAETLDEMFDIAAVLDRQPLPTGNHVAILSDGGGPGILCAAACEAAGLTVATLSEATKKALSAFLARTTPATNPLELGAGASPGVCRRAVATLLEAPEVDSVIAIHTPLDDSESFAMIEALREGTVAGRAAGGAGKPIVACVMGKDASGGPIILSGETIPTFLFPESAARALGKVTAYAEWRGGPQGVIPDFDDLDIPAAREICRNAIAARGDTSLDDEEIRGVWQAMKLPLPGVVAEGRKVCIRMKEDPLFGPLISFSLGGPTVEVISDPSIRVTPLTDRAAMNMVREVRGASLLEGCDVEAIRDVLLRVSRLVEEVPEIAEIDLSPIYAGAPGEGCRIAGTRIRVTLPAQGIAARYTTAVEGAPA